MTFDPMKFYREFPAGGNTDRGDWLERCLKAMCEEAVRNGGYVPDVDGERYRAIRDKGIAFSAWQDENGVQWAVNGRVGKDLDALVDEELLKRGISGGEVK